jgi:UDP-2,3-diacylglucosamine pyrophosphatase LpxH
MSKVDTAAKRAKYQQKVKEGLDDAFADDAVQEKEVDLGRDRIIIFSDHHRGTRDGADDFWRCERAYRAALGYYLEEGYELFLLGDVEELWENHPREVLAAYGDALELERKFYELGQMERFWGNHDDLWRHVDAVNAHFSDRFPGLAIREALKLNVKSASSSDVIFLVHGHQGTLDSDRWAWASRLAVRYGWRPIQRHYGMASTPPSQDFQLRAAHDEAMFEWARGRPERLVLIAGHTHRPVFSTPQASAERSSDAVQLELDELRATGKATLKQIADLRAELELVSTAPFGDPPKEMPIPCYFNTGCCCFGDGDVTGIELVDNEIRLVRWLNDKHEPRSAVLDHKPLAEVFEQVRTAVPA